MNKRKIIIVLVVVVVIVTATAIVATVFSGADPPPEYRQTLEAGIEQIRSDQKQNLTISLSVHEQINDGTNIEYIFKKIAGNNANQFSVSVRKNGINQAYSRFFVEQNEKLYVNIDTALAFFEDFDIEIPLADSDFSANSFVELPSVLPQYTSGLDELIEKMLAAHETAAKDKVSSDEKSVVFRFDAKEYGFLLQNEHDTKALFLKILTEGCKSQIPSDLAEMLQKQIEKTSVDLFSNICDLLTNVVWKQEEALAKYPDAVIDVTAFVSASSFRYTISVKTEEIELFSLEINTDTPRNLVNIDEIKPSKIIAFTTFANKLAEEIDDAINDNYESDDVWDDFEIYGKTLTLRRFGDAADEAVTYKFNNSGMTGVTYTFRTRDYSVHLAVKKHFIDKGYTLQHETVPESEENGWLEFSAENNSLFPIGSSTYKTPEAFFDYLLTLYSIGKEQNDA